MQRVLMHLLIGTALRGGSRCNGRVRIGCSSSGVLMHERLRMLEPSATDAALLVLQGHEQTDER